MLVPAFATGATFHTCFTRAPRFTRVSHVHPVRVTLSFTHSSNIDLKPQPLQSQYGVDREDLGGFERMLVLQVKEKHPYNLACMLLSRPQYMTLYRAE